MLYEVGRFGNFTFVQEAGFGGDGDALEEMGEGKPVAYRGDSLHR